VPADLATYRAYIAAFNITDSKAAFDSGYYVPLPDSLAARIRARAEIQPGAIQAIVGGIGFGKTTQLLAAAAALRESGDLEPRYVDVASLHKLSVLKPSLLLTLAGLELAALVPTEESYERASNRIRAHGLGRWVDPREADEPPDDDDPDDPDVWASGLLQDPNPIAQDIARIETDVDRLLSGLKKHLVLLFDGLDRAQDLVALIAMLGQDLQAFKRLDIGCVLALPEQMLFGKERSFLDKLDWHPLTAFDVQHDPKAKGLFKEVLARRAPPGLLADAAIELLIKSSGGVFRDLIVLARSAGEEAYMAGASTIDPQYVAHAADRFGRKRLIGLNKEQVEALKRVRKTGAFVETSDSDVSLLATGSVLQYARPHSRFEVHPTIAPLLRSLERAA
jgi:energy-coupling factor transporter ATP-binding protein EcfA2